MGLRAYILKRTINCFILLLFVITINFVIFMLMPGNPEALFMPPPGGMPPEQYVQWRERLKKLWGIGEPVHVRFYKTLVSLLTWNFGKSITTRRPVAEEMLARLPYTIYLLGTATTISIILGVVLGVIAAYKRGESVDSFLVSSSIILYSFPVFWIGQIFILIFTIKLGWFPHAHAFDPERAFKKLYPLSIEPNISQNLLINFNVNTNDLAALIGDYLRHSFLPLLTLVLFLYGGYVLLTRVTMLEALTEDYIITARAKGVPERDILIKHALKNASLPLITAVALAYAGIFGGAIITETVFSYPGIGRWVWEAISARNYPILMPVFYIMALLTILANFVADLLYGVLDPRIKYG